VDSNELDFLVKGFASTAYKPYNTTFTTGPICTTIYPASGASTDYAYDVSKIKYSFAAELRDQVSLFFLSPPISGFSSSPFVAFSSPLTEVWFIYRVHSASSSHLHSFALVAKKFGKV